MHCIPRESALRVCFFSHSSQLGGAQRTLVELIDDLISKRSVVCAVVLPNEGPLAATLRSVGAQCIVAEYGWWCALGTTLQPSEQEAHIWWSIKSILRFALPQIREFDPDIIWTQTLIIPWGAMVAAQLGKPHVWYATEFGELDHGFKFFSSVQEVAEDISRSSDHIFTCSKIVADTIFPDLPSERVEVLYCYIPPPQADALRSDFFSNAGAVKIGNFSTVAPGKGTEDIVRACARLLSEGRDIELLVAGSANPEYKEYLVGIVRSLGVESRVNFAGFLSDPYPAMRAIDIAVVCSRSEAWGRVGVETMLLGKPVIYPDEGGTKEYMIDGKTGLSYSPGDIGGLAGRLEILVNDPSRRLEMGTFGRSHALATFSRENYGGRAFQVLEDLRRKGRGASLEMPKGIQKWIGDAIGASPRGGNIGRNDPCPCGSGKRYKHCHGQF